MKEPKEFTWSYEETEEAKRIVKDLEDGIKSKASKQALRQALEIYSSMYDHQTLRLNRLARESVAYVLKHRAKNNPAAVDC